MVEPKPRGYTRRHRDLLEPGQDEGPEEYIEKPHAEQEYPGWCGRIAKADAK